MATLRDVSATSRVLPAPLWLTSCTALHSAESLTSFSIRSSLQGWMDLHRSHLCEDQRLQESADEANH